MKDVLSLAPRTFSSIHEALRDHALEDVQCLPPKHQRRFRGLVCLILLLYMPWMLTGCALFRESHEEVCDSQFVLDILERRNERIVSFVGQGEVLLNSIGREHRAKLFVAFLKPGYVMLKLSAPSGGPLMVFLVRNGTLTSYDFQQKLISEKELRDGVIRLTADVEIPIAQFIAACTGNVEPIAFDHINCYRRVEDDVTNLVLRMGVLTKLVQYVRLHSQELRTEGVQLRRDGQTELSVSFLYPKKGTEAFMPETVLIEFPLRLASIRIQYKHARINDPLLPEHFRFVVPEYWRTEDTS